MRVFGSIIKPTAAFLVSCIPDDIHRGAIRPKPVRHNHLWLPIPLHRALKKLKRSLAIPTLTGKYFEYLAFVVDRAPQVMRLAIYPNENLVQVPAPVRIRTIMNPAFPDLRSKHRAKTVPPEPHRLVEDV